MELLIDAKFMERFLSMRPKIFVAAVDASGDLGELSAGPEPMCDVWVMETSPRREKAYLRPALGFAEEASRWIAPLQPPATLSILAARTPAAREDLEALQGWWASCGPMPAPAIQEVNDSPSGFASELRLPLLRGAMTELQQSAAHQTDLAAQLYLLRMEHERSQAALQALQAQRDRYRETVRLAAGMPPVRSAFAPTESQGGISQYLPIAAEGLACFDLHFPRMDSSQGTGHLLVSLRALDRDQVLGVWRPPQDALCGGWTRFALAEALTLPAYDLQLSVSWTGPREQMPAISLADVGDWHEMRAKTNSGEPLDGGIALRLWTATPGARLDGGLPCGICLPGQGWEFTLNQSELARAVLSNPEDDVDPGFSVLSQLEGGGLLLHPTGAKATVAHVPNGCPVGTERVWATVKTNHPQAEGHVQYALFATRHQTVWELTRLADPAADPRVLCFSGWETVPPDQLPYAVCLNFSEPLDSPAHLVLATRTFESPAYAWAHWLEFRVQLVPPVQVFESPSCPDACGIDEVRPLRKIPA